MKKRCKSNPEETFSYIRRGRGSIPMTDPAVAPASWPSPHWWVWSREPCVLFSTICQDSLNNPSFEENILMPKWLQSISYDFGDLYSYIAQALNVLGFPPRMAGRRKWPWRLLFCNRQLWRKTCWTRKGMRTAFPILCVCVRICHPPND